MKTLQKLVCLFLILILQDSVAAEGDDDIWNHDLKKQFFSGRNIEETDSVITLDAPYRAEDPSIVPIRVSSMFPQSKDKFIKKIWLLVDKNPFPFVGEFDFFPESGKADLALRIRINSYSTVRAIAETNDGRLSMVKKFVKASGGCSAPVGADMEEAMRRLGKVKFRLDEGAKSGEPAMLQLLISHPNLSGMQMDQTTRFIRKADFIDRLAVSFNGKPVLKAKLDIAISTDPNFRFYFIPDKTGELKAEFSDMTCESPVKRDVCNKGRSYSQSYQVSL